VTHTIESWKDKMKAHGCYLARPCKLVLGSCPTAGEGFECSASVEASYPQVK
jgi:hypothetical protein